VPEHDQVLHRVDECGGAPRATANQRDAKRAAKRNRSLLRMGEPRDVQAGQQCTTARNGGLPQELAARGAL